MTRDSDSRATAQKGEITLAKEAALRLRAWLDMDGMDETPVDARDIGLVLCHYAKLCKKPRNGRSVSRKGYVFENQSVNYLKSRGLECYRVPLSGAGREKGDISVTTSWGQKLKLECKSRKELAKWIIEALGDHDAVVLKQDRGETFVLTRLPLFADFCQ